MEMICHCDRKYEAREADLKRGWALSCSKRCAAIRRDYGKPKGKRVDGLPLPKASKKKKRNAIVRFIFDEADDFDPSWDAHKDSF